MIGRKTYHGIFRRFGRPYLGGGVIVCAECKAADSHVAAVGKAVGKVRIYHELDVAVRIAVVVFDDYLNRGARFHREQRTAPFEVGFDSLAVLHGKQVRRLMICIHLFGAHHVYAHTHRLFAVVGYFCPEQVVCLRKRIHARESNVLVVARKVGIGYIEGVFRLCNGICSATAVGAVHGGHINIGEVNAFDVGRLCGRACLRFIVRLCRGGLYPLIFRALVARIGVLPHPAIALGVAAPVVHEHAAGS